MTEAQTVFLADDNPAMRESMTILFEQADYRVRSYRSAQQSQVVPFRGNLPVPRR